MAVGGSRHFWGRADENSEIATTEDLIQIAADVLKSPWRGSCLRMADAIANLQKQRAGRWPKRTLENTGQKRISMRERPSRCAGD